MFSSLSNGCIVFSEVKIDSSSMILISVDNLLGNILAFSMKPNPKNVLDIHKHVIRAN